MCEINDVIYRLLSVEKGNLPLQVRFELDEIKWGKKRIQTTDHKVMSLNPESTPMKRTQILVQKRFSLREKSL